MKKIILIASIGFLFAACGTDGEKEANPYPDGVYPFEVTGVGHTWNRQSDLLSITWTIPNDKGFKNIWFELYGMTVNGIFSEEYLIFNEPV